jgi:RNA polymerase sigma-70 factor (sigma-E family)
MTVGDRREDFQDFAAERAGQLFKVAYFICGDWHDAQDLLQTSLAKLFVAWNRIEQIESADAYARKILLRTYLSQRRLKRSGEIPTVLHEFAADLAAPAADHDLHLSLVAALKHLPPRNRAVVVLHFLEGHDLATVARYLDTTESAVKSLNSRSLRQLRSLLATEREMLLQP